MTRLTLILGFTFILTGTSAAAQEGHPAAVEAGWAHVVFGDDGAIDHSSVGARVRLRLTDRIWLGPELIYMRGPGADRDLFLMGVVSFDVLRERRVTPYVTTAGGIMFHSDEFASWSDPAFVVGAGARVKIAGAVFLAAEGRVGSPLHTGVGLGVGYRLGVRDRGAGSGN